MQILPGHFYREYVVVINTASLMGDGFADAFSIHKATVEGKPLGEVAHQRSVIKADRFSDEPEAIESAKKLAHAWIDLQHK